MIGPSENTSAAPSEPDCGCRAPAYFCSPQHQYAYEQTEAIRERVQSQPLLSRRERRARGGRGPLLPSALARETAARTGLSPSQVTSLYAQEERERRAERNA